MGPDAIMALYMNTRERDAQTKIIAQFQAFKKCNSFCILNEAFFVKVAASKVLLLLFPFPFVSSGA